MALDFQSSRTLSLAQAGRGGALLNDTVTLNPSLLGFQPVASLSGTFNWLSNAQLSAGSQPDTSKALNVSVIDGKNPYVGAGISFTRKSDLDMFHLALAKRVLPWLSLGASGKRFNTRSNSDAASGKSISGYDGGASVSFVTPPEVSSIPVQVGITGDNLRNRPEDEQRVGPRQLGLGVKANFNSALMVYGDAVENFSNFQGSYRSYSVGTELALGADFYVRGGLMGFRERGWSAGGGWVGPKIGVSYGYQNRRVQAERGFTHAVTMDIYM